jgi:hypothetical protein
MEQTQTRRSPTILILAAASFLVLAILEALAGDVTASQAEARWRYLAGFLHSRPVDMGRPRASAVGGGCRARSVEEPRGVGGGRLEVARGLWVMPSEV